MPEQSHSTQDTRPVAAIINYGEPDLCIAMVLSLLQHDPTIHDGSTALIVVDAGSPEPEFELLQSFLTNHPDIQLFYFDKRADYSRACNWVWKLFPHAPVYFFLNNDLIIPTPVISRMLEILKYDPRIGILTPLMNTHGPGQNINSFIREYPTMPGWTVGHAIPTTEEVLRIDNALQHQVHTGAIPPYLPCTHGVAFSCVMVQRRLLDELGGQDELFPYGLGADDDLCLRASRTGWAIATAMNTFVGHIGGAALKERGGDDIRKGATKLIRLRWPETTEDLISVIIPTYNCAQYLWACLSSLLAQTYKPREIIVVDDGSTDGTDEVLKHFNVIKITNRTNLGAGAARNKGFEVSGGRYVVFCDADAVYDSMFLEKLHSALVDTPPEIGYAYCDLRITGRRQGTHYSGEWSERKLRKENFICCPTLIKRGNFPGFDTTLSRLQDWDLWLRMWFEQDGVKGTYVNETLYRTIERQEGISGRGDVDLVLAGEVVREKYGI